MRVTVLCVIMTVSFCVNRLVILQGMNDILARFLLVFHNEVDSYWGICGVHGA